MPWPLSNTIAALVVAALIGGVAGWLVNGWRLGQEMERERADATAKVLKLERDETVRRGKLEVENAKTAKKIEQTLADNRRLVRELGGMRDPGQRAACPLPGTASESENSAASARLSEEASDFLLEFAAEADRAAGYAKTCHEWAISERP